MTVQRRTRKPTSYVDVDLTAQSDEKVMPLTTSKLQNKRKREVASPTPSEYSDVPDLEEEEYEVDYIVQSRLKQYGKKVVLEYFIHWKDYPEEERTWTLADQFDDDDPPVVAFYEKNPRAPRRESSTPFSLLMGKNAKAATPKKAPAKRSSKPTPKLAKAPAPGKENRAIKKPRVTESDEDEEFVPPEDDDVKDDDDDDYDDDEDYDDDYVVASESDGPADDFDEEDEDSEPPKPAKAAKKTHGSWGVANKGAKKAAVKLGSFRPKIKPLNIAESTGAAHSANEDLPPIHDIPAMFDHMVSRVPTIVDVVKRLNGRKLRVATMCSGTESPLLALNMIANSMEEQYDVKLNVEHVFSCEIEPFKQAYIERNFRPPILFRDVTELGRKKAHTAYGSLVDVPGNVDLLIAGTSCVDYSGLNNVKQDIDANGESGRTFRGMLQWVNKHRPPVVLLENVCSAPWDKVVQYFGEIKYDANYVRLDTKEFYIPHTRTRVYLYATPMEGKKAEHLPEKWMETVKALRRPWSSSFEAFLLPADHPDIHRARLDLAAAKYHNDGSQRKPTDWGRCESRHARARQEEELGNLRPLTAWKEAGVCKGLDWTWNDWLQAQTERVVDLLEISTLRMAKEGIDSGFKACIWNVSQNVDRQTGSSRTALAQCLTPNMIPWVTNRGGPVIGREALSLQGIPVRELLLTSENEDQLADLAGNAMTSTVVGASIVAALQLTVDKLEEGEDAMKAAAELEAEEAESKPATIVGSGSLTPQRLDLAKVDSAPLQEVLRAAQTSSRHCECEGQSGTASAPIDECTLCGYRSCTSCGGRPEHAYRQCHTKRLEPTQFERLFKSLLPMRVKVAGFTKASLDTVRRRASREGKGTIPDATWKMWCDAVVEGVKDVELRFRLLKRQSTWTAVYEGQTAILELWLKSTPEWRLTIKTPPEEPVNSPLRKLLLRPVARLRLDPGSDNLLSGDWEVCVPSQQEFRIEVTGCGDKVPTWQASLGLQGRFVGNERWSKINVRVPPEAGRALDRDVSGVYTLLPKCGQNQGSLHKQEGDSEEPLFFYLSADRVGNSSDDQYVFSTSIERVDYGTERDIVASLDKKWRESTRASETPKLLVNGGWVVAAEAKLTAVKGVNIAVDDVTAHADEATFAIPSSSDVISTAMSDCDQSVAILSVSVPLDAKHAESMWTQGTWGQIDLDREGNTTFANLAWITERLPPLDSFSSWSVLNDSKSTCLKCAPQPPTIHWIKQSGKFDKAGRKTTKTMSTVIAFEDRKEAGVYEYRLKHRPQPFSVQLRLDDGTGSFRIGLNPSSLAHRAMARLPHAERDNVTLSWRLVTSLVAEEPQPPRVFLLPSNKRDPQHPQPEGFLLPLRKEQLRSLWWMLQQEQAPGKTHTFVEEEISEAALHALGWRAEGKAERPVMVRGGVIADQVGYGKTIISLALVAETRNEIDGDTPEPPGLIDVRATLIIVPGHLSKQWPSEIERFTGKMFRTVVIRTMKDLANVSIADISQADIVIMAAEVFDSDVYWERFEYLGAQPEGWLNDKQGGRFFGERLDTALETLRQETEALKGGADNAVALMKDLHQKSKQDAQNKQNELRASNFGKRLKGAAYRDKYDATAPRIKEKKPASGSRWEVDDDDEEDDGSEDVATPAPTFREAKGTEAYSSSNVRKNHKLLSCPLLHMFRFRRVIADEFTYLEKRPLAAVLRLASCYKWVLSGTPPVDDFASIRTIATFMGIHLGVEDDAEGSAQAKKARAKEQTAAERFHSFRETHSAAWHRRRDDLAQDFLNTFVRQNIAEIDDIPTTEHIHSIRLPASEGAVYLELEHHLQALEMQARKETKFKNVTVGDRNARLEEALADSRTAEEALLKRCCHFTLDLTNRKFDAKTAQEACEHIASVRRAQLLACEDDLRRTINKAVALNAYVKKKGGFSSDERQPFKEWAKLSFDVSKHDGDVEAAERLITVLEGCGFEKGTIPSAPEDGKASKVTGKPDDVKWELREQTHLLRRLAKELVGRVRSLRFFEVVRNLQLRGDEAAAVLEGSECGHTRSDDKMAILSCCGHVACLACMTEAVNNQKCVKPDSCHAPVRHTNIVKVSTLGVEGELSSGRYGAKLQRLVDLIRSIPKKERILVFLQWDDLMAKVSEALDASNIGHVTLAGGVKAKANTLDAFQKGNSARVLVLKMNDASAAGSNLTMANHAIFIGPLFTPTLLNYRSTETQAIGRVRRFGQEKKVHIHRLLVQDTIDYTIFNARTKELSEKADYVALPRGEYVSGTGRKSRVTEDVIEIEDEL